MTTIATDGCTIAADGMSQHHGTIVRTTAQKLHRLPDGSVIGGAGEVTLLNRAIRAIRDGEKGGEHLVGEYSLLRLHPSGRVDLYDGTGTLDPLIMDGPSAVGSGMDFALAAMKAGASAQRALRIASELDPHTGGRVRSITLRP